MERYQIFASLLAASLLVACGSGEEAVSQAVPADVAQADDASVIDALAPLDDVATDARADAGLEVSADAGADTVSSDGACGPHMVVTGDFERHLQSGGVDRVYRVHVPRGYDPARPAMVVLNFHGYLSNEMQQADWSNMNDASDTRGFIAVHPRGRDSSWNAGACCGLAASRGDDDVGFVRAILDAVGREYCVDPRRVFATGFSNGGFLSNRLACELSDRIAAIAPVSGDMAIPVCTPGRPVPVAHFHGDADLVVPFNGSALLGFPPATDSVRGWAMRDGCGTATTEVFHRGDARCLSFMGCAGGSEVIFCVITGGGHTWPGGGVSALAGHTSTDLDATTYMLDFFERHPMP